MEKKKNHRRSAAPPRIPEDIRNSTVETHLAKSRATGNYRPLRSSPRKSVPSAGLALGQLPLRATKGVPFQSSPGALGGAGGIAQGKKISQQRQQQQKPPISAAPAPSRLTSSLQSRTLRRSTSAGDTPTDAYGSSVDALSACSALIAKVLRLEQGREERGGGSPGSRGPGRISGPPLTRRVSAAASPRDSGSSKNGRKCSSSSSSSSSSSNAKSRMQSAPATMGQKVGGNGDFEDGGSDSDSGSTTTSSSSSSESEIETAAISAPNTKTQGADSGGRRRRRSSSTSFYDYWSYYNSHPASIVRSGTREMVDDILSSANDDCSISAPAPSITPPIRTLSEGTSGGGSPAPRSDAFVTPGGAGDGGGMRAQATRALGKTGGSATENDKRARDTRLRLEELRKHSENGRCADCSAPCADWASVAQGCFVCLNCAGQHRNLGMHVTFTRSLTMDKWTEGSLRIMEAGGNERLAAFARRIGLYPWSSIEDKYTHPCLPLYREHVLAVAEGKEPPPLTREALEQAVLTASGEETPHDEKRDDGDDGTSRSDKRGGGRNSTASASASKTADVSLKTFMRSFGNGCGGIRHALQLWSCPGVPTPSEAKGRGRVETGSGEAMGGGGAVRWVPDEEEEACMVCEQKFSLVLRRHHCRRCGRLTCSTCAPANNTRPIVEWGFTEAVRHCRRCYQSPLVEWTDRPSD